jgi:hypothetical protein
MCECLWLENRAILWYFEPILLFSTRYVRLLVSPADRSRKTDAVAQSGCADHRQLGLHPISDINDAS